MKIDPKALHDTSGIGCKRVAYDERLGTVDFLDARIAFVTERSVQKSKVTPGAGKPIDVRLGDALLMWKEDGKSRGQKIDAGKDAGVQISLEIDGRAVMQPFTGAAMLVARERLRNRQADGFELTADQDRALDGIQGVLDIILADPDPARFDPAVIGNAFAAAMTDAVGPIALPVSPEDFGRKARADLLRARISRIDPDHPDGFCTLRPLDGILDELGIETGSSGMGTEIRGSAGQVMNEPVIRRAVKSNDRLAQEVFGRLTTTPVMRLSAAAISADDYENLTLSLASRRISGAWIDSVGAQISEITREMMPGYRCEIRAFSTEGRDILVVKDDVGTGHDLAYVYSWPTADRVPLGELDGTMLLHISPEEIPDEQDIRRLTQTLEILRYSDTIEQDFELDGVTIPGRGPRRA